MSNKKGKDRKKSIGKKKKELYSIEDTRKEALFQIITDKNYKPLKFKEFCYLLQVPKEEKEDLRKVLDALVDEGRIVLTEKGKYQPLSATMVQGTYIGNAKGFGFVEVEGQEEDYFISEKDSLGALHGDTVLVRLTHIKSGKRKEGAIVKIISRGYKEVIGTYEQCKGFGFVIADNPKYNKDIFIPERYSKGAVNGHKVYVEITSFGDKSHNPEGKVIEVLGHPNDPGVDVLSIIKAYDLPMQFPDEVMEETADVPDEVDTKAMAGRTDLRELQTVTIDGEDAKDLDDAVTLTQTENGIYHLGVHIADVSEYVKEGSPLDQEALNRGTSVYLVDRVIPMLPHKLSNGICSLNAGENRLALSCLMDIDTKGDIIAHSIKETVIKVDRRMSYTSVKKILLDHDEAERKEYEELIPMFEKMLELSKILRAKREKRGGIDFDFPESKITLDANGRAIDVEPYERNEAHMLIEDFMLAANETIAEDYFWQEIPFEYRTHEAPDAEKVKKLEVLIKNFGYYFKAGSDTIHPKEYQKLLKSVAGTPEEAFISRISLRSMKQAKYATVSTGHFGLATRYYCHFTSPIRRYPDLQIHRIIKENLRGKLTQRRLEHYDAILPGVAEDNSKKERRADEAERTVDKAKKVQFMKSKIGCTYEGIISGITAYGIYVELPNTVEGMVSVQTMIDDSYFYDEENYVMMGKTTGKTYTLGQKVKVTVDHCDSLRRTIDFIFCMEEEEQE